MWEGTTLLLLGCFELRDSLGNTERETLSQWNKCPVGLKQAHYSDFFMCYVKNGMLEECSFILPAR